MTNSMRQMCAFSTLVAMDGYSAGSTCLMRRNGDCWGCCPAARSRERAGDRGGAAWHLQPGVDVLQVDAHGSLRYTELPGDLAVGVPGGDQAQQFPLPGRQLRDWMTAALGVEVGLVQVGRSSASSAVTLGKSGHARVVNHS
jgi:hypothetical protein